MYLLICFLVIPNRVIFEKDIALSNFFTFTKNNSFLDITITKQRNQLQMNNVTRKRT